MQVTNIQALRNFIYKNSGFQKKTINNVIKALGFPLQGSGNVFNELSIKFENCAEHGANFRFNGFSLYKETIAFFRSYRQDIISHMEQTAADCGMDIISMVQNFGIFKNKVKPTPSEIGKALWDSKKYQKLTNLYNVFAWYALEEIAHTWYRHLEENPAA